MKADDPRHGTDAGYQAHRRDRERACKPCRTAANEVQRLREASEPIALTGGRWVPRPGSGGIQVWEEAS